MAGAGLAAGGRMDTPDNRDFPAIVVGAGPAGLATSCALGRRGIAHLVLERGDRPGWVWANLYNSLTLHTGRHMSGLPGMPMPRHLPLFPPREAFVAYLAEYARRFALPVRTGIEVRHVARVHGRWVLATTAGTFRATALVVATGIVTSPRLPALPGRDAFGGQVLHASAYHRPSDVAGRRVLVVGVGNSGGEIASELAAAGRLVDIAVRSGANVVPREIMGIPTQYVAHWLRQLPRPVQLGVTRMVGRMVERRRGPSPLPPAKVGPLEAIPLIGFHLVDAIRAGRVTVRPGIDRLTGTGAAFTDGSEAGYDAILLATGYTAALAPLDDLVRRDARGFARRRDRVQSADLPGLCFVGHNYDASGGLRNIARDAPLAAAATAQTLWRDAAFAAKG